MNNGAGLNEATRFGGFWIRVGASLIDMLVLSPLLFLDLYFIFKIKRPILGDIITCIIWWVYYAYLHSSTWQASVGKKILGLKVVDADGNRISFGRATCRFLAEFISALILGVGYMMVGWTKQKQGLHDIIVKTFVIKKSVKL